MSFIIIYLTFYYTVLSYLLHTVKILKFKLLKCDIGNSVNIIRSLVPNITLREATLLHINLIRHQTLDLAIF
jgi:hypothetical protein